MRTDSTRTIDAFIGTPDVSERHETLVRAPAALVFEVAQHFDMQSIPIIRGIFRLRAFLLRSRTPGAWKAGQGLIAETAAMGWGTLVSDPGRLFIAGAVTQPWLADVAFTPVPPDRFASFAEPDRVKIVWTIEAEALGPALTRFVSETRVAATDDDARRHFRRYWRLFGMGILMIRWLLVPAIRREAERRHRSGRAR